MSVFDDLKKMFSKGTIITPSGKSFHPDINKHSPVERNDFTGYRSRLFYSGVTDSLNNRNVRFNKVELYKDYEEMDRDPIISSALDLYSEESSVKNAQGDVLDIKTDNIDIYDALHDLFYDRLNIEFNLSPWVRGLVKYGDQFLALDMSSRDGIIEAIPISVYDIEKMTGSKDNPHLTTYRSAMLGKTFDEFEMVHFTYISDGNFLPYGRSLIENGRKIWKMLALMEDAMLIHRILRAPEKRIFKIDVGNIPPEEVDKYMDRIMNQIRRTPYYDPATGDYNLKYNMQNITEDFFFAIRGDASTSIDTLGGLEYTAIDDIEYLRKRLLSSLRIPAPFLGFEEAVGCVVPETKILMSSGGYKTVKTLIDEYENGIVNEVYSYDITNDKYVKGIVSWAGYTRMNAELMKVTYSNGIYDICTPDHKFLTIDGEWVEARDLENGLILRALSTIIDEISVISVEKLDYTADTCDITIDEYHNFITESDVVLHNSKATLAAEDLRFARTIEKIQRVVESELRKIAWIHLYILGFRGEELNNYKLTLTNPSIIYEQEKIALLNDKASLAGNFKSLNMHSEDWIYKNIFNMTTDEINNQRITMLKETQWVKNLESVKENGLKGESKNEETPETDEHDSNSPGEDTTDKSNENLSPDENPEWKDMESTGSKELHNNSLEQGDDLTGIKDLKNQTKSKKINLKDILGVNESTIMPVTKYPVVEKIRNSVRAPLDEVNMSKLNDFINTKELIK